MSDILMQRATRGEERRRHSCMGASITLSHFIFAGEVEKDDEFILQLQDACHVYVREKRPLACFLDGEAEGANK